jgi:hypothetical protein
MMEKRFLVLEEVMDLSVGMLEVVLLIKSETGELAVA